MSVQLDIFGNPIPESSAKKEKKRIVYANSQLTVTIKEEKLPPPATSIIKEDKKVVTETTIIKKSKRGRKSYTEMYADVELTDVPDDEKLKEKLYYSISEVATWFNVTNSQIRFWESEFDILKPRKNRKGDRLFRVEDVQNLKTIYFLLRNKKYSIEGAKEYLKANKHKTNTHIQLKDTLTRLKQFLLEIRANLDE